VGQTLGRLLVALGHSHHCGLSYASGC
jgi:hypothetical protein